jgi:hypothetical protein
LLAPLAAGLACRHGVGLRFSPVQKTLSQWLVPTVFLKCLVSRACRTLPKPCRMFERPFLNFWRTLCLFELGVSDNSCSSRFLSALVASLRAAAYTQGVFWSHKACRTFLHSHVDIVSPFELPRPFLSRPWAAENDVKKSMNMSNFCPLKTVCTCYSARHYSLPCSVTCQPCNISPLVGAVALFPSASCC